MGHRIESELVANVITVHVTEGQTVAAGDELVLLESMKMEIPVLTEGPGRIAEVKVTAGDVVQEGEVLVVIDD
ncbi:biotin/lipoyl-binding carrier protein [Janibacter alittae]|uniref:Biotin/lipoyl-binding carrier protein n=1 Tax=Janibacter alittae TaxID=3115209 RepID=A0ABZ2MH66_9MICO